ncbi:procathepsin L-like isoform X2 [Haliotis rufescens]|uniref:procathepsin L-like isoform X1 n=1 Tax=Haliotis rufescens TaxID=6454 RepID=UPI00201F15F2|nr:procathepsin L-like isoform X1 [Haliotis rufescens]XP_048242140.1 procathepsin L-like isoform X1 [Haliotis rufescens]XP_048242141.1 procathepsin L-like isoform X2 [Haliotis rufescens]
MFRFAVVALLAAVAVAVDLNREWAIFKTSYNKNYLTEENEVLRRMVWENNVKYIQTHNLEADRGLHTYRLGVNEYADLTTEEFVKQMNGLRMANTTGGATFLPPSVGDPPAEVDWRTKGYVTEVKNQLACGSCWAFSATGSLEGQHFKKNGKLVSLSEQNLVDCSKPEGNHGCGGGRMEFAFEYIKVNEGIDTETSYAYKARDDRCRFKRANVGATDTGFTIIQRGSESDLQNAVATVGPISIAIDASRPTFRLYKSGIYDDPSCSSTHLDHGVLAVGYGTTSEGVDYWLVKNSWGTSWGDQGYLKMSRNKDNQCGIATSPSYPIV